MWEGVFGMELVVEDMPGGVTRAVLTGRMDIEGALAIDAQFGAALAFRRALVVDLAGVSFMASMGLRTLMLCARAVGGNGGRMALAQPQPNVAKVLEESGIGDIIGVYPSVDAASAAITT
jgi:anti-sigma B factor antagonist